MNKVTFMQLNVADRESLQHMEIAIIQLAEVFDDNETISLY